ncbi:hypothetical protein TL16_g05282 [Triparma laevis f. inornata]|uniref:Uncharacterized protein n=2 Tax=Triparma laevis TaxID=1534972 RepID=A0A9W6ZGW5_9STRA|nr:hypothetical protein TrLO_g3550 [Triparma laevis f. longispina]GMH69924.1 hypothetical protein TL16_g05282 [Triparma laevis f. inornata]
MYRILISCHLRPPFPRITKRYTSNLPNPSLSSSSSSPSTSLNSPSILYTESTPSSHLTILTSPPPLANITFDELSQLYPSVHHSEIEYALTLSASSLHTFLLGKNLSRCSSLRWEYSN